MCLKSTDFTLYRMRYLLTAFTAMVSLIAAAQPREELLGYNLKPAKMGAYYFALTEKKDSLWKLQVWYLSQKSLYQEAFYKDEEATIPHGPFTRFHTNRNLWESGGYANGKKEGLWTRYNEEGRLIDSSHYKNGHRTGVSLSWHANGFPSDSTQFDGQGNGVEVSWRDDGSVYAAGHWKEDTLKTGRWKYYHPNGTPLAVEEYDAEGKLTFCRCYTDAGVELDTADCREQEAKVDKLAWRRHLERSLMPVVQQKAKEGVAGTFTVMVRFLVEKDGSISEMKALTTYGYGIEEEVMRIIKRGPKFVPGKRFGRPVRSYHSQPVTFQIQ